MGASHMREGAKKGFSRYLRNSMTDSERHLWHHLRQKQMHGHRFRRQHPIGPYVVDFACLEQHLIVEVDGGQYADSVADTRRTEYLSVAGFRVQRFWNNDVINNIEGVIAVIQESLAC